MVDFREFSNHPDQWSPNFETRLEDIQRRCAQLGVEANIDAARNDIAITSGWVPFSRMHEGTGEETVWCNINHAVLGKDHPLRPHRGNLLSLLDLFQAS